MSETSTVEQARNPNIVIRPVLPADIEDLHPVFETWIRDRDTGEILTQEIAKLEEEILSSIDDDNEREYFVAENDAGKAIGIMGMQSPPYDDIVSFASTRNPMETINAYVAKSERLSGAGITLAKHIENLATQQGYTELLVNSGPRYKNTGWPFWTKLYGQPSGVAVGLYGPGGDAMVWRKSLGQAEEIISSFDFATTRKRRHGYYGTRRCWAALYKIATENNDFPLQPTEEDSASLKGNIGSALSWLQEKGLGQHAVYRFVLEEIQEERSITE